MKIRMKLEMGSAAVADADAAPPNSATTEPTGSTGAVVATTAAGCTARFAPPDSRRDTATADHASAPDAGDPDPSPPASHDNNDALTPRTADDGASATAGSGTAGDDPVDGTGSTPESTESSAGCGDSTDAEARTGAPSSTRTDERTAAAGAADGPATGPPTGPPARPPAPSARSESPRLARVDTRGPGTECPDTAEPRPEPAEEPSDPEVSAAANGSEATAAPTPSATANAPTRPTYRAASVGDTGAAESEPERAGRIMREPFKSQVAKTD